MNNRRLTVVFSALGTVGAIACVVAACSNEQPRPQCTASRASFAAKYTVVSQSGTCTPDMIKKGEKLGVQAYVPDPRGSDPLSSMAIKSEEVGQRIVDGEAITLDGGGQAVDTDPAHLPYALGKFGTVLPGDDNICRVAAMAAAEQFFPEIPPQPIMNDGTGCGDGGTPEDGGAEDGATAEDSGTPDGVAAARPGHHQGADSGAGDASITDGGVPEDSSVVEDASEDGGAADGGAADGAEDGGGAEDSGICGYTDPVPALHVKYEWTNVRVYVAPEQVGVQFTADLAYARDDCVVNYKVLAVSPAWDCAKLDADGNVVDPPTADDALCSPVASPNVPYPADINSNIVTKCDPDLLLCVPVAPFPGG